VATRRAATTPALLRSPSVLPEINLVYAFKEQGADLEVNVF